MLKVVFSISSDMTRLIQPISPMHSQENAPKLQIWLASLRQNTVKMRKINGPWPKCEQLKMQSRYICMSNFKPFLPCILKKIARNPKFDLLKWCQNEEDQQTMAKIWVRKMVRIHQHAKSSGHSSLVFSKKCPEVANLTCFTKSKWCQNEESQQMMTKI